MPSRLPSAKRGARALDLPTLLRLRRLGPPTLSADGRAAVCALTTPSLADNRSTSQLWWLPLDEGAGPPRPLTQCGEKDGQPAFSPRGDRIAFIARREQDGTKDEVPQLYVIGAAGGEARRVTADWSPGVESFRWCPDGRHIVFAAWVRPALKGTAAQHKAQQTWAKRKESGFASSAGFHRHWDHTIPPDRALHLHRLDVETARIVDLFEGTAFELPRDAEGPSFYSVSPDGKRLAFAYDPAAVPLADNRLALAEVDLRRATKASGRIAPLLDDPRWSLWAPSFGPGGELAFLAAEVGRHHMALAEPALLDIDAPGGWRLLAPGWDHDAQAPLRWSAGDGDGASLLCTAEERGRCHLWRIGLDGRSAPVIAYRGGWVQGFDVVGQGEDEVRVALADGASHPARLWAQRGSAAARRIESFNDTTLAAVEPGPTREVVLTGAEGVPVQMWLTFPPGFGRSGAGKRWPVLHVVHGGPHTASGESFSYRWNAQLFAGWGFVVAQVNFHGSSGFGFEFRRSLHGRQGQLETADIEAATDWLTAQPWCDAKRVYASGGSYGGFLVAWMNGHVPAGRYRAYVCHAGVFDRIATFAADSWPTRPKDLDAQWWLDMPKVLAQSPHASAAKMATPTLVIHGAQDFRVPDCNGLAYFNTLQALGVPSRLLWFPDENHWVLKPANSAQWHREFEAWLRAH
jgi:dipeptidyl aminopeptidase/acylaminoacyl peptidase